jgi:hypothetical protein
VAKTGKFEYDQNIGHNIKGCFFNIEQKYLISKVDDGYIEETCDIGYDMSGTKYSFDF